MTASHPNDKAIDSCRVNKEADAISAAGKLYKAQAKIIGRC